LPLLFSIGVTGCGATGDSGEPMTSGTSCSELTAKPLSVPVVRQVLVAHGFGVEIRPDERCTQELVAKLANAPRNAGELFDRVLDEEGYLVCSIERAPIVPDSPLTVTDVKEDLGSLRSADAIYELANVNCSLYTSDMSRSRVQVLREALEELSRKLRSS